MLNHKKLKCYVLALDLTKRMPSLTSTWPKGYAYLIDQLKRAVSSIVLNIAEGNGRYGHKERGRFFSIARASAAEVSAAIDVAEALNLISSSDYIDYQDKLLHIVKILYKLK